MAGRLPPEVETALVEESAKKSGLVWLNLPALGRPRAVWHVWVDGSVYVVGGGQEQPLPGLTERCTVEVTARSKDNGTRLVTWTATCRRVLPETPEWDAVVPQLHSKRLNASDGEAQPLRWAVESEVWALEADGGLTDAYGRGDTGAHLAPPPPSNAVTSPPLPTVLHRRQRRRPSLTD